MGGHGEPGRHPVREEWKAADGSRLSRPVSQRALSQSCQAHLSYSRFKEGLKGPLAIGEASFRTETEQMHRPLTS